MSNITPNSEPVYDTKEEESVQVVDVGVGSIDGLNLFERKAALVNAEIDKMGFGRYQWCIWFLCGFGYFLDLCWAQGVSLMATAVYQELGVPADRKGRIGTLASAGLAIGSFSIGITTDIIGRKWAFNISCLITSIFGTLLAASGQNYNAFCGIYFLACIGLGGNIPIDATIALEFLPSTHRHLVSLMSIWQPIGVVAASGIAYGTVAKWHCNVKLPSCHHVAPGVACCTQSSNMGWRYMCIVVGGMTLFVFFARYVIFRFHESPKWLVSKGKEQEAIDVLHKIAKFNKCEPPTLCIEDFQAVESETGMTLHEHGHAHGAKDVIKNAFVELSFLKGIFARKIQAFTFFLLALAYMGDYWSFNLAGYFLPIILLENNVSKFNSTVSDTFKEYIYIYLPGILGAIIALCSVQLPLVGRKWSLVFSAAMQGLAMAMYTQVKTTAGYVGLNAFEYVMQSYFNAVLYASAPEMFDTTYRASAGGMLSCLGRLSGIVAPFAGQKYIDQKRGGILWLAAGGIWLSSFVMCFLPIEMRGKQMY